MKANEMNAISDVIMENEMDCVSGAVIELIDRYAEPTDRIGDMDAYLRAMVLELRGFFRDEAASDDISTDAVRACRRGVSADCVAACEREMNAASALDCFRAIVWRVGLVFAMRFANAQDASADNSGSLQRLACALVRMDGAGRFARPNAEVLAKLLAFANNAQPGALEIAANGLLAQMGEETDNPVRRYGHPIDSGLVKALDNELINGVFRAYVNFNADRAMSWMLANSIPVTAKTHPDLNRIVDECVAKLNIQRPYVVVTTQLPGINAVTFGSDEKPYIAVSSLALKVMSEAQMRFIIGHECGHIAMGHLIYHTAATMLSTFSAFIPVVGKAVYKTISYPMNAWSRRSEITADRAGLHCCGDAETAKKALLQIECGYNSADDIDIEDYIANSEQYLSQGLVRRLGEYSATHPMTPKRIEAIDLFAASAPYCEATGKPAPAGALSAAELAKRTEQIIKVL